MNSLRAGVLVIGGGPAGLAASIAARLKGFDVTLVDGRRPPIDKACGEGILPGGVEALRRLGLALDGADAFAFRGIRLFEGQRCLEARFASACGVAVRRTDLHSILAQRAAGLGVRLLWGTTIPQPPGPAGCRWIVGADGLQSRVRTAAGLDNARVLSTRFGFRRHYRVPPWSDMVEVHWGMRCQIYVTPIGPGEIGVTLLSRDRHLRLDAALPEFPVLACRLRNAPQAGTDRGAVTTCCRLRRVYSGRTALIGDASGSVDAITGEGLSLAFRQALALGDALGAGRLADYQAAHRRLARPCMLTAGVLLAFDRFPCLRRAAFALLDGRNLVPSLNHLLRSAHRT